MKNALKLLIKAHGYLLYIYDDLPKKYQETNAGIDLQLSIESLGDLIKEIKKKL